MCRIGEARVPGPSDATLKIGICNPSGLQGKNHILSSIDADVLAISETHLTKLARRNLEWSFRSSKTRYRNLLAGAPMAPRSASSDAGHYAGVAFATTCPCRTVAAPWPPDIFETGRIQFGSFFTAISWVTGAVVYGFPEGRNHLHAHARTEAILDFAFHRLVAQPGPKFFAGDWNFALESLAITEQLRSKGWVEVQDLWFAQTGQRPLNTCKGATRKDSPELAVGFHALLVDHEVFADHSVLVASFACNAAPLERFVWPCPQAVSWPQAAALPAAVDFAVPSDPTQQYAQLWKSKEANAQRAMGKDWLPSMGGRGSQTAPRRIVGSQAPIKQGRSHDVQPGFFGFCAQHAKQFKQLRRLQNYCRWIGQRSNGCMTDGLHGIGLWNAILRAPGFGSSFSEWWLHREYVSPLDPPVVPAFCPGEGTARQIFDAVLAEVRLFEQRLQRARGAHRVSQHDRDRNLVFRDVARCPPEPVETLLHRVDVGVVCVDLDESAVELDRPISLLPDEPLWIAGQQCDVIHAEHDKVWIQDISQVQVADRVVQTKTIGDLQTIFDAFHEQWQLRWCKHDNVPFSHWTELLDFAKRVIRPHPVPHVSLDSVLIQAEAARKKKRAATGLDGVSRRDILLADPATLASLESMYRRAEVTGEWPSQLVAGKVHSLAKTEAASAVGDYRPITIFGLAYRIWSSVQSRHLLRAAETWVDDSVFGNRCGRQAANLWSQLLQLIEEAYATATPLAGISADLEKCFNCIPRYPALCLAVLVGTPNQATTAWSGALAHMCRHFKVRESFSQGFLTSTGLAEGCGLSVFGMLLVDHLFACWMRFQAPAVQCLTYVDDWQSLTRDPDFAVRQLALVERFAGMLDLTVDRRKTFGWATCPELRRSMRTCGIPVFHHARELGGHFGVSKQYTNRTVAQRLVDLDDFWTKLKACKARHHAKTFLLRAVAWPRGLHAIASAPIGDQIWLDLRRKAVKAIGWQRPGVNPSVLLGLVEFSVDPQFVALLWTLRSLRLHCPIDFWVASVAPLAHGDLDLPPNSMASIALQRVQAAGLSVTRQGMLTDRFGSFCPQSCNNAEIELRLAWAWTSVVAHKVSHRAEFDGLWQADLATTRKALLQLSADDQAMYRLGLAGGLFTERYKSKWTDQADKCKWCGEVDTLHHRYWSCPQHADLRASLAPDVPALLDWIPAALSLRGWALLPPTWSEWIQLLVDLPADAPPPAFGFPSGSWSDVFTDGSCLFQASPALRCAAWSATLVPPFCAGWSPGDVRVLCASYLPGVCQTAYRAELYAVAYTLHWAAVQNAAVRIWTDCKGVVSKFHLLVRGGQRLNMNRSNADLWSWILQSVDKLGSHRVDVVKVRAHLHLRSALTKHEAWMIFHNQYADKAARLANQMRSQSFWTIWERHARATATAELLFQQVKSLHIAIGRRQVQDSVNLTADPVVAPARQTREFVPWFVLGSWRGAMLPQAARLFGTEIVRKTISWFFARLALGQGAQPIWVSFTQLYIDFQLTWGHPGPLKIQQRWVDSDQRPYLDAGAISFKLRVRWFRQLLKKVWQEAGVRLGLDQCWPSSTQLQAFLPSAAVPWDARALDETEQWLEETLTRPCVRNADALLCLPLAAQNRNMRIT